MCGGVCRRLSSCSNKSNTWTLLIERLKMVLPPFISNAHLLCETNVPLLAVCICTCVYLCVLDLQKISALPKLCTHASSHKLIKAKEWEKSYLSFRGAFSKHSKGRSTSHVKGIQIWNRTSCANVSTNRSSIPDWRPSKIFQLLVHGSKCASLLFWHCFYQTLHGVHKSCEGYSTTKEKPIL